TPPVTAAAIEKSIAHKRVLSSYRTLFKRIATVTLKVGRNPMAAPNIVNEARVLTGRFIDSAARRSSSVLYRFRSDAISAERAASSAMRDSISAVEVTRSRGAVR